MNTRWQLILKSRAALIFSVTILFALWITIQVVSVGVFSLLQMTIVIAYVTVIVFLGFIVCILLDGWLKRRDSTDVVLSLLMAVIFTYTVYSIYLLNSVGFVSSAQGQRYMVTVTILLAGFLSILGALRYEALRVALNVSIVGLLAYSLLNVGIASLSGVAVDENKNENAVTFNSRPNVYFLGLDALTPASIIKSHLNIKDVSYIDALKENNFRTFYNAFSDRGGTENFYNSFISMNPEKWDKLPRKQQYQYFTGENESPLFTAFKSNGYKIQTLFMNPQLGSKKGPYVDFVGISNSRDICTLILLFGNSRAFFGLCSERGRALLRKFGVSSKLKRRGWDPQWEKYLFRRMMHAAESPEPWLTIAHTLAPAHVKTGYNWQSPEDFAEYKNTFIRREKLAAGQIEKWVQFLKEHDPNAILFVYGDHGFMLTAGRVFDEKMTSSVVDFLVKDRGAISASVWPRTACQDEFDSLQMQGYLTMTQLARRLIVCLSGEDALDDSVKYLLPYEVGGRRLRYEDYLYETPGTPPEKDGGGAVGGEVARLVRFLEVGVAEWGGAKARISPRAVLPLAPPRPEGEELLVIDAPDATICSSTLLKIAYDQQHVQRTNIGNSEWKGETDRVIDLTPFKSLGDEPYPGYRREVLACVRSIEGDVFLVSSLRNGRLHDAATRFVEDGGPADIQDKAAAASP